MDQRIVLGFLFKLHLVCSTMEELDFLLDFATEFQSQRIIIHGAEYKRDLKTFFVNCNRKG